MNFASGIVCQAPPLTLTFTLPPSHSGSVATQWSKTTRGAGAVLGKVMIGLSRCSTELSSPPTAQVPNVGSGAKNALPARLSGRSPTTDQSRSVKSGVPSWVSIQRSIEDVPLLKLSANRFFGDLPGGQTAGGACASNGWKLHWVGGVRNWTASIALATWAQSVAEMTCPDGAPVARDAR